MKKWQFILVVLTLLLAIGLTYTKTYFFELLITKNKIKNAGGMDAINKDVVFLLNNVFNKNQDMRFLRNEQKNLVPSLVKIGDRISYFKGKGNKPAFIGIFLGNRMFPIFIEIYSPEAQELKEYGNDSLHVEGNIYIKKHKKNHIG